ncbi:DUF3618 domain-containing protein [Actinoplanes sp. L3-i22]|uniref:DUF3618 domain-containing protein n=1 Tax=Actinoplanes sp. L3-i22 TaxID=2836373 RepID=UPI001C7976B6|nr:DUF3618 domain-containing protein [Actinoplanes sp. L3-i22]BCY10073.1 hypothetical protein L3i22_051610 [Actinoplanes sp. L3-i22]
MTPNDVPAEPEQLRDEIQQTRADLGDTVEALAAKTDVTGRAKHALAEKTDQARDRLSTAAGSAAETAKAAAETAKAAAGSAKAQIAEARTNPAVRRKLPPVALAAGAATAVAVLAVIARRRRK